MSNTSILQGIRAHTSKYSSNKQFIIKSKPNIKQTKQTIDSQSGEIVTATQKDIDLFLNYMKQRSTRFEQLLAQNAILNEEEFCKKHLFSSVCIRTILKAVLDKLLADKRLGKNLKGMNKSNMEEIQKHIWSSLERQVALYQNERKYNWERDQLKNDLQKRKRQILKDLENISLRYESVEKELCLDQKSQCETEKEEQNWASHDDLTIGRSLTNNDKENQQILRQNDNCAKNSSRLSQTSILSDL